MTIPGRLVVAMPALYRPELLATTLWSFDRGLFRNFSQRTLILNVDAVGIDADALPAKKAEILALAHHYFDEVISRFTEQPGFSQAVQWIWQQAIKKESFFLHLEDDWVLNRPVPVQRVLDLLAQPGAASLRLQRQRNLHASISPVFSLNPLFFNSTFITQALTQFQTDRDPEKQFSSAPLSEALSQWKHLVMPDDAGGWVSDIGVHWRKSQGLRKVSLGNQSAWVSAQTSLAALWKNKLLLAFKLYLYRKRVALLAAFSRRTRS